MHLSRIQIRNFRNFSHLDAHLAGDTVLVGENRVGKSNLIFALRLVLDVSLPDSARQLKLSDIWDGVPQAEEAQANDDQADHDVAANIQDRPIEIHLDFAGFDDEANLTALLTDYRLADDHTIARLSYVFRRRNDLGDAPLSEADFEFKVFGANDETRSISSQVRRRICLDVLSALRDAEGDLGTWRSSPLRPLLEDAVSRVPEQSLSEVAESVNAATAQLTALAAIEELETNLRAQIASIAGDRNDIKAKFGFTPTDPLRLFRAIRLLIDDGKRSIADASLGSANLALLTLKLAEFAWRQAKNERNYTLLAIEEPEAHLHPQLQRKVYGALFQDAQAHNRSLILTTHSPNIVSIAPLRSIVLLKDEKASGTKAYSLAKLNLNEGEISDIQRYLDATRAEILFSRSVIFVEGDAESTLLPVFARSLGHNLDELGVTVCSVAGVNFQPYARFAAALNLPFAIITDWDPQNAGKALGWSRSIDLIQAIRSVRGLPPFDAARVQAIEQNEQELRTVASDHGIFLNASTLETQIAQTAALLNPLLDVLLTQTFGPILRDRLTRWRSGAEPVEQDQLMLMIGYVSKGRFATQLAAAFAGLEPPEYIRLALQSVVAE